MPLQPQINCLTKKYYFSFFIILVLLFCLNISRAETTGTIESGTIDRIHLVSQQINLLKNRLQQNKTELEDLQKAQDQQFTEFAIDKASKNLLDKASLEVSVSKSNLDSINIELSDTQQTINWLQKNIQEIENQLNVLNIFGMNVAINEASNIKELRSDLNYQQNLLSLEKIRSQYLQDLQKTANNLWQLRKENHNRLINYLKSHKMLHIKQQQIKDELIYQEQQNYWLKRLNTLHAKLAMLDPVTSKEAYTEMERDIFYSNEKANFAYTQSLIARYKDQIQQMSLAILKNNSISLLNEMSDQIQALSKQINRLNNVLNNRLVILNKHINYLSIRKNNSESLKAYIKKLILIKDAYLRSEKNLADINKNLISFRKSLDNALQNELSSRQGFPSFGTKMLIDLGKEMLLVPALAFQVIKSLSAHFLKSFHATTFMGWSLFGLIQIIYFSIFLFCRKIISQLLARPSVWREQLNSKWLGLQWLNRNAIDLAIMINMLGTLWFFSIPIQNFIFIVYLCLTWLIFKGILTIARLCLLETTHHASGHDVKLYRLLKWMILIGGSIIALTVFIHQLPLIYELKTLCDRLFLCFLLIVSLLLLRSRHVIPHLILSQIDSSHPYLEKSIRLISVLIPTLMLGNSIIGLFGFMNFVMTISWYEGIFLIVLIGYLILRGLLSDGMEQVSRLLIQYTNNGWLWTEAFLKPIDKLLRIGLFLSSWIVLFLLYGLDKQSPIVTRLAALLNYQLVSALNTTITPKRIITLMVTISVFYWVAKWTREFVYRMLASRTNDMGIRTSIAILSQYSIIIMGLFVCLRVLGIDLKALAAIAALFSLGVGLGLRDLANNFACGFLILLERPLRVGDIVSISGYEGEVVHIGSRAITVRTWDHMELLVPNAEVFHKSFTNWTAKDNIVRSVLHIKISRYDDPHHVRRIIEEVLANDQNVLKDPSPEVYLKEISDSVMEFELRYFVNIRDVKSRTSVVSVILMNIWDTFAQHGIKPPYPQHEVYLRGDIPNIDLNRMDAQKLLGEMSIKTIPSPSTAISKPS